MIARKERLTVTVDRALVQAGSEAVAAGRADSLSGWVNQAMAERAARERKLRALTEAIATYEAEYGPISQAEIVAQDRSDRRAAVVVRGRKKSRSKAGRRAGT